MKTPIKISMMMDADQWSRAKEAAHELQMASASGFVREAVREKLDREAYRERRVKDAQRAMAAPALEP